MGHNAACSAKEMLFAVMFYGGCSCIMLIVNKLAISHFPVPGLVFLFQVISTVLFIVVSRAAGLLEADKIQTSNVLIFIPYAISFVTSIYSNGKVLQYSNVETVIVFRACSPMFVSVLDYLFLGRDLPNLRSSCALLGVVAGAIGYALADSEFQMHGMWAYSWTTFYLGCITFEMTYGKKLISSIKFKSPVWGPTLYTNLMAVPGVFACAYFGGELDKLGQLNYSTRGLMMLALSGAVGTGISWAGWNCRDKISATAFTLVGVTCKFVTVLINISIWDKHASAIGILWLAVCLLASSAYRQAPMKITNGNIKKSS